MSIMLLLILALVSMQPVWPGPRSELEDWLGPIGPAIAIVGCLALVWAVGSVYTWWFCRAIRRNPSQARQLLKRFHARQKNYFPLLTITYLGALYFLGWGDFVSQWWLDSIVTSPSGELHPVFWPGRTLVMLAPFLAGLACSWARFYDAEKTVHQVESGHRFPPATGAVASDAGFLSRLAYLKLQVRFNLLLIVPPLFLMLLRETVLWTFPGLRNQEEFDPIFFILFLLSALMIMPWMLRVFLGLRPLPPGPLRDRLEATSRRLKFRCSAILLWNTRNSSANAMVTGVLPWPRYIVLTDQLLRDLSVEEVEAVIGHEVGHVKHHHMFFYMVFLFASLMSMELLWQLVETFLHSQYLLSVVKVWVPMLEPWLKKESLDMISALPPLLGVALYLFVVFGYLSRYCETQADIFGSRAISSEVFISALEKVAILNGIPREKPGWLSSWRHPTIANRVDFLRRMGEQPSLEPRFQRRIGVFKWSLTLGLAAVLAALFIMVPKRNETNGAKPPAGYQQEH